jgi:hypothetical protein
LSLAGESQPLVVCSERPLPPYPLPPPAHKRSNGHLVGQPAEFTCARPPEPATFYRMASSGQLVK